MRKHSAALAAMAVIAAAGAFMPGPLHNPMPRRARQARYGKPTNSAEIDTWNAEIERRKRLKKGGAA